jgi:hypothetical protein
MIMRAIWTRLAPGIAILALALASGSVSAQFSSTACSPSGDFVTGGGFIIATGAHANFGVAGGCKNGFLWGHLEYVDHSFSPPRRVHGTEVLQYFADSGDPARTRWIGGRAEIDGASGFFYCVRVTDNGEGASAAPDMFAIRLSNGYTAAGPLVGGNIQIHNPNPATPTGDCLRLVAPGA